jgi:hypothetical protein
VLTQAVLQSARGWRLIASFLESAREFCRLGRVNECVDALHSLHGVALLQAGRLEQAAAADVSVPPQTEDAAA